MPQALQRSRPAELAAQRIDFLDRRVHLIGVGGCGMSGVAGMLINRGAIISGSDQADSALLKELRARGANVHVGHLHSQVPPDTHLVVASAAVQPDNPELLTARAQGIRTIKYAELLGEIMVSTTGVAVAGTHGKSTTTAMIAFLACELGLDPSFIVGAVVPQLGGGSGVGRGETFIVEACEYDRSFLKLAPTHALILNIEEDHLDYFRDLDDIAEAFVDFASLVPADGCVYYNHDDSLARRVVARSGSRAVSFGMGPGADWRAVAVRLEGGLPGFEVQCRDRSIGLTRLAIPGTHNVLNALAAVAALTALGADPHKVLAVLPRFEGVSRRLSHRGRHRGIDVLDDYAHHPTEIRATLRAVREGYRPKCLRVVFQPHQVSRTRFFLNDFAASFELADEIIVPDIYFVRDSQADAQLVSSNDLVQRIQQRARQALYIPNLDDIAEHLARHAREGDVVLTMGAGDVWKVADEMVSRLGPER